MRILSLTAQKPDSTGSGVYLAELVRGFAAQGHVQAVLCGTVAEDEIRLPAGVAVYPVCYQSGQLPFPVCGMSDELPYTSTRYRDLSEAMTRQLMQAFRSVLRTAVSEFKPHVILCHHLYFLAAMAREMFPDIPVYGQCHGSGEDRKYIVYFGEELVHKTCKEAAGDTLHQNHKYSCQGIHHHKGSGITGEKHSCAEGKAQACTGLPAVEGGTHNNGYQHQRDGEHTELDSAAKELKNHDDGGKQSNAHHVFGFAIHLLISSLLSLR